MMSGTFRDGHPWLQLTLKGQTGNIAIDFVVDTGFNGEMALPHHLCERLRSSPAGRRTHALADGSRQTFELLDVSLTWFDESRITEIVILDGEPLIGTVLLESLSLEIEVIEGGSVTVSEL